MADESNWQNQVESPQRGGVTGEVHRRRHGPVTVPDPDEERSEDAADEGPATDHEQAVAEGYDGKWQKRFSHLPGVNAQ